MKLSVKNYLHHGAVSRALGVTLSATVIAATRCKGSSRVLHTKINTGLYKGPDDAESGSVVPIYLTIYMPQKSTTACIHKKCWLAAMTTVKSAQHRLIFCAIAAEYSLKLVRGAAPRY
jgi:hypothetical protein